MNLSDGLVKICSNTKMTYGYTVVNEAQGDKEVLNYYRCQIEKWNKKDKHVFT